MKVSNLYAYCAILKLPMVYKIFVVLLSFPVYSE